MKDYQPTTKYVLPQAIYHQTVWKVRDYYRLRALLDAELFSSPAPPDGQPRGGGKADEVATKAMRRERALEEVGIIEGELQLLPAEYQVGVWKNIQYRQPYPEDASRSTYSLQKQRYLYEVAKKLFLL